MHNLKLRAVFTLAIGVALMVGCGGTWTQEEAPVARPASAESKVHAMTSVCHDGDGCDANYPYCCAYLSVSNHYSCYQTGSPYCTAGGECPSGMHCVVGYGGVAQCFTDGYACENQ